MNHPLHGTTVAALCWNGAVAIACDTAVTAGPDMQVVGHDTKLLEVGNRFIIGYAGNLADGRYGAQEISNLLEEAEDMMDSDEYKTVNNRADPPNDLDLIEHASSELSRRFYEGDDMPMIDASFIIASCYCLARMTWKGDDLMVSNTHMAIGAGADTITPIFETYRWLVRQETRFYKQIDISAHELLRGAMEITQELRPRTVAGNIITETLSEPVPDADN